MDSEKEKPKASTLMMVLNVTNTITHLCLGGAAFAGFFVAGIFTEMSSDLDFLEINSFPTHIYLCTFGYIILFAVGFLAFDPSSNLRTSLQYPKKKLSHLVLQIIGSILAIIGSLIILVDNPFDLDYLDDFNHLDTGRMIFDERINSAHGILGLIAMVLTILSLIGGVVNFLSCTKNNRALITTLHTCLGTATIIVALITLCIGFDYIGTVFGDHFKNLAIAVTSIGLFGVILSPAIHLVNRLTSK